jgi:predicted nucleic acid-binding protein
MDDRRRVVLDTDVAIDFFAGARPMADAVGRLLEEDRAVLTSLTIFELASGARSAEQLDDIEMLIDATSLLDVDVPASLHAAAAYRELRSEGRLLDAPDLLIAGCCLAAELPLMTRNRSRFERVRGLELVDASDLLGPEAG